jgi:hypothetical protein
VKPTGAGIVDATMVPQQQWNRMCGALGAYRRALDTLAQAVARSSAAADCEDALVAAQAVLDDTRHRLVME